MTLVALIGDCTTTTCLVLAAAWPTDEVIVLEADPTGGSLSGWLDTPASPSLATIVANTGGDRPSSSATITSMIQRSGSGIRFVAAPIRSSAARRAIDEAAHIVLPWFDATDAVVLVDIGRVRAGETLPVGVDSAAVVVIVHRQATASAAAAAVRLERLVEQVEQVAPSGVPIVLAVIGAEPFDPAEIAHFVHESSHVRTALVTLAHDELSAVTLAGRAGVSARRLQRLPLMRSAAHAADIVRPLVPMSAAASTASTVVHGTST